MQFSIASIMEAFKDIGRSTDINASVSYALVMRHPALVPNSLLLSGIITFNSLMGVGGLILRTQQVLNRPLFGYYAFGGAAS